MKRILFSLSFSMFALLNILTAQDSYPINDLPEAQVSPATTQMNLPQSREFTTTNCDDLTIPISIQLGIPSPAPGSPERVGIQDGRIFRDGIATQCPSKPWPGIFSVGYDFGYHAIQFSNCSAGPVCITVNFNVDGGASPCGTNAHAMVYQSGDGSDPTPYDPTNQGINFIGDVGSSVTQPFSVEVNPGYFEVVFTNNFSISNCDLSFSITVPGGNAGSIQCSCESVPVSNWALILAASAIAIFTFVRFRRVLS